MKFFCFFNFFDYLLNTIYYIFVKFNLSFLISLDSNFNFLLIFSFFVYLAGLVGLLLNLKNILITLLFVELTYFGIISFVLIAALTLSLKFSFLFALLLILIAAAESAVGLGILIIIYTFEKRITFDTLVEL